MPPKKQQRGKGSGPQVRTLDDVEKTRSDDNSKKKPPKSQSTTDQDRVNFQKMLSTMQTHNIDDAENTSGKMSPSPKFLMTVSGAKVGKQNHVDSVKGVRKLDQASPSIAEPNSSKSQHPNPQGQVSTNQKPEHDIADRKVKSGSADHGKIRSTAKPMELSSAESGAVLLKPNIQETTQPKPAQMNSRDMRKFAQPGRSDGKRSYEYTNGPRRPGMSTFGEAIPDLRVLIRSAPGVKKRENKIQRSDPKTPFSKDGEASSRLLDRSNTHELKEPSAQNTQGNQVQGPAQQAEPDRKPSTSVLDKNPILLLQAAINIILPKAKEPNSFHCHPCDKPFMDVSAHFMKQKENHAFKWKMEMRERTTEFLPPPSSRHLNVLTELVTDIAEKYGMTEAQQTNALDAWQRLNSLALNNFNDCKVRLFGSHFTGIALSENRLLNMDLCVNTKDDAACTFVKFIDAVERDDRFIDISRVISTNFAHAKLIDKMTGLEVQLSLNNSGAYLTSKLIKDYVDMDPRVRPLCVAFRYWGKLCGVDQGEEGSWQGHAFPLMVIHFLQQAQVLPVLHDMVEEPNKNPETYLDPKEIGKRWSCQNDFSVGKLWLGMLRYYAFDHDVGKHIVTITQFKPYLRSDTKWNAKRIAIIDPFQPKHNISRYISSNMYDYVHSCLLSSACAHGIPHTETGPIFGFISSGPETSMFQKCPEILDEYHNINEVYCELVLRGDETFEDHDLRKDNEIRMPQLLAKLEQSKVYELLHKTMSLLSDPPSSPTPCKPAKNAYAMWCVTPFQAKRLSNKCRQDLLCFGFNSSTFTGNEKPPIMCTACHRSGHLRAACPDEVVPKMPNLPPITEELMYLLNDLGKQVFDAWGAGPNEYRIRCEIRDDLLGYLRQYYPDVELKLFGSSLNGFGGKNSDVDICLTFCSNATGERLCFPEIVEEITQKLHGHKLVYRLQPITTAKVPIVKFAYGHFHIEVDVSVYNMLGIMNTELLRTYSCIDPRVRPLVYMMKRLAKTTAIGDASRGSLSSYAYSLMTLYFLQQVEPPVLPVLQELTDPGVTPPEILVENANVYFYKNLHTLEAVWPHRYKNRSSLAELWLQLLRFYASHEFHESQRVVCIRKKAPLFKFDKLWTSSNICIEDPFDLTHNLGSGLSKRMNIYIVKTFQNALKHFSRTPNKEVLNRYQSLEDYFYNEQLLTIGKPPSDRGCHICHSIGHLQNDCPMRRGRGNVNGHRGNGAHIGGNRGNMRPNFNNFNFNNNRGNNRDHRQAPQQGMKRAPPGFHNAPIRPEAMGPMLNRIQHIPTQPMPMGVPPGLLPVQPVVLPTQVGMIHPQMWR